jgi:hypothetical protein
VYVERVGGKCALCALAAGNQGVRYRGAALEPHFKLEGRCALPPPAAPNPHRKGSRTMRAPQFGHKPTSLAHLRRASFRTWAQARSEPADRREADFLAVLRRDPGFPTSACTWDRIREHLRGRDVQKKKVAKLAFCHLPQLRTSSGRSAGRCDRRVIRFQIVSRPDPPRGQVGGRSVLYRYSWSFGSAVGHGPHAADRAKVMCRMPNIKGRGGFHPSDFIPRKVTG